MKARYFRVLIIKADRDIDLRLNRSLHRQMMMDKAVICRFQAEIDNLCATLGFRGRGGGDVLRWKL